MSQTYIRFERIRDGITGPQFGPFAFVQLTYDELRIGPNGEPFARFDQKYVHWFLYNGDEEPYSDVIVWSE